MSRFFISFLALATSTSALAETVNLGEDAVDWQALFESYNTAANNDYGSPAALTWTYDPANTAATVATAYVRCGAYAAKGFIVGALLTESELESLTGSSSPEAAKWYDAIVAGASVGEVDIGQVTMATLAHGDILVAKYTTSTDTGHIMLVDSVQQIPANSDTFTSVVPESPADATDHRWMVVIHDATKSPHGSNPSATARAQGVRRDSRNEFTDTGGVEDQGVGVGTIVVYTNATTGAITGWRWSYNGSYYTAAARPMVAGRITEDI